MLMHIRNILLLCTLPAAFGQYGYPDTSSTSAKPTTATASSSGSVQTVAVAQNGGLTFTPDTVNAAVGDLVVFQFFSAGHSVTEASFDTPCQPANSTSLNSGFSTTNSGPNSLYTVKINSTDPIWFYCAQLGHCQAGMVGVINPPSTGQNLAAFRSAAKNAGGSTMPSGVQGGTFGNPPTSTSSTASPTSKSWANTLGLNANTVGIATLLWQGTLWLLS